jgi:hypothetical protein
MYIHIERGKPVASLRSPKNSKTLFAKNKEFLQKQGRLGKILKLGESDGCVVFSKIALVENKSCKNLFSRTSPRTQKES